MSTPAQIIQKKLSKKQIYLNNPKLKKAGVPVPMSQEELEEYMRCKEDPTYFIENYVEINTIDRGFVKLKLYPFQKQTVQDIQDNRFIVLKAGRQVGKCFFINTIVKIRNTKSGEIFETTIGKFYERFSNLSNLLNRDEGIALSSIQKTQYDSDQIQRSLSETSASRISELSDRVERKFVRSINVSDWEVSSDSGWVPITHIHKTIKYKEWVVKTISGKKLICADDHIVFDAYGNQTFIKNLKPNSTKILTENGPETVISVYETDKESNMFDLTVNSNDHRLYTNGILSHNTTTVVGYLLWYILFDEGKLVAILANKAKTSREILDRIKFAYEQIPIWMQQGITAWNKGDIELENKCRIIADSTSGSAARGYTIHFLYLDEFAFVPNNVADDFFTSVFPTISSGTTSKILISSTPNGMNHFYRIWKEAEEGVNGFHFIEANWRQVPGRDEAWAAGQKRVLGEQKYMQEMECVGEDTVITVRNKNTGNIEKITIGELYSKIE